MASRTVDLGKVVGPAGPNEVSSNTDTALNGVLFGNGSKVGAKALDTSSLTNDNDHVPTSGVVKSALDNKADTSTLGIVETGNTATHAITINQYVIWKGALYTADANIAVGAALASSGGNKNLSAVDNGGLNSTRYYDVHPFTAVTTLTYGQSYTLQSDGLYYFSSDATSSKQVYFTINGNVVFQYSLPIGDTGYNRMLLVLPLRKGTVIEVQNNKNTADVIIRLW